MLVFVFVWVAFGVCQSSRFNVSDLVSESSNSEIICPQNEECSIICDTTAACKQRPIQCPDHYPCSVSCPANESCYQATIECPLNNTCNVECNGASACQYLDLVQPKDTYQATILCAPLPDTMLTCADLTFPIPSPNQTYHLNCGGQYTCQGSNITCPIGAECNIVCGDGVYNCHNASIISNDLSSLSISCGGNSSCSSLHLQQINDHYFKRFAADQLDYGNTKDIKCGEGESCTVECVADSACYERNVTCPSVGDCDIICSAPYACAFSRIICPLDGYCNVQCGSESQNACQDLHVIGYDIDRVNVNCSVSACPSQRTSIITELSYSPSLEPTFLTTSDEVASVSVGDDRLTTMTTMTTSTSLQISDADDSEDSNAPIVRLSFGTKMAILVGMCGILLLLCITAGAMWCHHCITLQGNKRTMAVIETSNVRSEELKEETFENGNGLPMNNAANKSTTLAKHRRETSEDLYGAPQRAKFTPMAEAIQLSMNKKRLSSTDDLFGVGTSSIVKIVPTTRW